MHDIGAGSLLATAVRTAIVLVALIGAVRLFGKRHTGELNLYDLLLVLIIANAVQNAMTRGNGHIVVAIVSAGTLMLAGWLGAALLSRRPGMERRLLGAPAVVVQDGRLLRKNLRRESIGEDELMMEVRKQGLADLASVKLAVLEIDGSVSVVPRDDPATATS
jgi:uncharacterized membrane protein YcaP (DUF421 family)